MPLPHITNTPSGINKYEPLYKNIFEVSFTLPRPLQDEFNADIAILSSQVLSISGLDVADKGVERTSQKGYGVTRSYLNSKIDDTSFDITVTFALNLRNGTDNFVYKLLKAWKNLGYNLETGETALKTDYTADFMKIQVGNRAGDINREIIMKDVFIFGGLAGMNDYGYDNQDLATLEVHFSSDWAQETVA